MNFFVALFRGVVQHAEGDVLAAGAAQQISQQGGSGGACANDGHVAAALCAAADAPVAVDPVGKPDGQHKKQGQHGAGDSPGDPDGAGMDEQIDGGVQGQPQGIAHQHHQVFPALRVPPETVVDPEDQLEHQHAHGEQTDMGAQVQKENIVPEQMGKKQNEIAEKDQKQVHE